MEVRTEKIQIEAGGKLFLGSYATADIPAATSALEGCLIYDTTANKLKFCTGSAWETVTSS